MTIHKRRDIFSNEYIPPFHHRKRAEQGINEFDTPSPLPKQLHGSSVLSAPPLPKQGKPKTGQEENGDGSHLQLFPAPVRHVAPVRHDTILHLRLLPCWKPLTAIPKEARVSKDQELHKKRKKFHSIPIGFASRDSSEEKADARKISDIRLFHRQPALPTAAPTSAPTRTPMPERSSPTCAYRSAHRDGS